MWTAWWFHSHYSQPWTFCKDKVNIWWIVWTFFAGKECLKCTVKINVMFLALFKLKGISFRFKRLMFWKICSQTIFKQERNNCANPRNQNSILHPVGAKRCSCPEYFRWFRIKQNIASYFVYILDKRLYGLIGLAAVRWIIFINRLWLLRYPLKCFSGCSLALLRRI